MTLLLISSKYPVTTDGKAFSEIGSCSLVLLEVDFLKNYFIL